MKIRKSLNYFVVSNELLKLNLTENELIVIVYLSSIYSTSKSRSGTWVRAKQSTIAKKCGIKTTQTVGRNISSLMEKGLISKSSKLNNYRRSGTACYILNLPSSDNGYFLLDRKIFNEGLTPIQMKVYLLIASCISTELGYCWNSYNDMARKLDMERKNVIKIVSQLVERRVIRKQLVKSRVNKKVHVDNKYFIIGYAKHSPICGGAKAYKKKLRLSPTKKHSLNVTYKVYPVTYRNTLFFYVSISGEKCQANSYMSRGIFLTRGVVP